MTAFRAARISDCLGELHSIESIEASALEVRAALRIGDLERALRSQRVTDGDHDRSEMAMLAGATYHRLGRRQDAVAAFIEARSHAISAGDAALEAELAYYFGLFTLDTGDADDARGFVESALENVERRHEPSRSVMTRSLATARLHELLAIVEAGAGRYRDAIAHAREALGAIDASEHRDVWLEGYALQNLAISARDFDLHDAASICGRIDELPWTSELARVRFTAAEASAWCAALRGRMETALGRLRTAAELASDVPQRIAVALDRALFARESGFAAMAAEELRYALGISRDFAWEKAAGDARIALLQLAQVAAPASPVEARVVMNRYSAIAPPMDARFASRSEPRVRAEESYAHGLLLRAEGRLDASAERLGAAFKTWQLIGFEWRASRAALELAELGAGDVFRLAVRRELRERPESIFAARARFVA